LAAGEEGGADAVNLKKAFELATKEKNTKSTAQPSRNPIFTTKGTKF